MLPATGAGPEPPDERVHEAAGDEAENVLDRRDEREVVDDEDGPQERRVAGRADRLRREVGRVREVGERVAVEEQRRPVGDLDEDAQPGSRDEQRGEQPVAADQLDEPAREGGWPCERHSLWWWIWVDVTG